MMKIKYNLIKEEKDTKARLGKLETNYGFCDTPMFMPVGTRATVKGLTVISTPQGVIPNNDPNSLNEGIKENIVDGDINTYFHSSYDNSNKTPFPHEYIFDLGGEKSFNNLEIYTRTYDHVGVIGDYEIFIADEYDGDKTVWSQIADDKTRKGNSKALADIKISLPQTTAKYLKIASETDFINKMS